MLHAMMLLPNESALPFALLAWGCRDKKMWQILAEALQDK